MTFSIYAVHADVTLTIDHPRFPSRQTDRYTVKCENECFVEILSADAVKGNADKQTLEGKIKELIDFEEKGGLPKPSKALRKVLYQIRANDGKRTVHMTIGYPMSYEGAEFSKYSKFISFLEDLKFTMRNELRERK